MVYLELVKRFLWAKLAKTWVFADSPPKEGVVIATIAWDLLNDQEGILSAGIIAGYGGFWTPPKA